MHAVLLLWFHWWFSPAACWQGFLPFSTPRRADVSLRRPSVFLWRKQYTCNHDLTWTFVLSKCIQLRSRPRQLIQFIISQLLAKINTSSSRPCTTRAYTPAYCLPESLSVEAMHKSRLHCSGQQYQCLSVPTVSIWRPRRWNRPQFPQSILNQRQADFYLELSSCRRLAWLNCWVSSSDKDEDYKLNPSKNHKQTL